MMALPTTDDINDKRVARFKDKITDTLAVEDMGFFYQLVEQYRQEHNIPAIEIAAALAKMAHGDQPFLLPPEPKKEKVKWEDKPKKKKTSKKKKTRKKKK